MRATRISRSSARPIAGKAVVSATVLGLAVAVIPGAAVAATSWAVVSTPNRGSLANTLYDVAATPSGAAWAVGSWYDTSRAAPRTLAMRWTGSAWTAVTTPNVGPYYNELQGADATSASDAWAVGYSRDSSSAPYNSLAMHYNGTAWTVTPTPQPGVTTRELYDVEALSGSNAWAVGWYYDAGWAAETLIVHWNGATWSQVPSPSPGSAYNQLYGVGGSSANDVWAVGTTVNAGEPRGSRHPLALHWNGSSWASVSIPNPPSGSAILRSVAAISPTDAWAVGSQSGYSTPVAYHWNGSVWSVVATPTVGTSGNNLFYRVAALDAARVWAVGYRSGGSGPQPLVERWNGTSWTVEPTPALDLGGLTQGVATTTGPSGTPTVWVAGFRTSSVNGSFTDRTLTLRGTGS